MQQNRRELTVFGRSPFIDQVDVPRLLQKRASLGFNHFGKMYQVDYLFFYDQYFDGHKPAKVFTPFWFPEDKQGDVLFAPKPSERPLRKLDYQDGAIMLGYKYFTVSSAVNWAVLAGYQDIYLVGVDHSGSGTMKHFDGIETNQQILPEAHQRLKRFIRSCSRDDVKIYQTNPAVRDDWELPFKPIEELY